MYNDGSPRFVVTWFIILCVFVCLGCEQPKSKEGVLVEEERGKASYTPPQMIYLGDISDALLKGSDKPKSPTALGMAIEADEFKISLSISLEKDGKQQSLHRSSIPVKKTNGVFSNQRLSGMLALGLPKILRKESDDFIELEFVTDPVNFDRKKPIRFKIPTKPILESLTDVSSDEWHELYSPSSWLSLTGPERKIELPNRCSLGRVFAPGKESDFPDNLDQTLNIQVNLEFPDRSPTINEQVHAASHGEKLVRSMLVQPYDSDEVPSRPAEESLNHYYRFESIYSSNGRVRIGTLTAPTAGATGSVIIETSGVTENETTVQFTTRLKSQNSVAWADEIRVPTTGFAFYPMSRNTYKTMFGSDSEKKYLGILLIPADLPTKENE
jgi:hypothetical protein